MAKLGRIRAKFCRTWARLGRTWPIPNQVWSIPGEVWTMLAEFAPTFADCGKCWPNLAKCGETSLDAGPKLTGPTLAEIGPRQQAGAAGADAGHGQAVQGRHGWRRGDARDAPEAKAGEDNGRGLAKAGAVHPAGATEAGRRAPRNRPWASTGVTTTRAMACAPSRKRTPARSMAPCRARTRARR